MADRVVLCMRWGPLFPAVYVNVLHAACRRQLSGPFRFVCLTDRTEGLHSGIEALPLPDLGRQPLDFPPGVWQKLSLFQRDLFGLTGRALFIDLDTVILSSLEPFFEMPGDLIGVAAGARWTSSAAKASLNTTIFAFDLGEQFGILKAFMADQDDAFRNFVNEQAFVEAHASSVAYWPDDWIVSYKRHLRRPVLIDRILPPKTPPSGTKIVAFHGDPRPAELVDPGPGNRDKFPHYVSGAVPWVRDYWRAAQVSG